MSNTPDSTELKRIFLLSIFILTSISCTTTADKKTLSIDPAQVRKMLFQFENTSESFDKSLPSLEISERVAANLSQAGYSVVTGNTADYSHNLSVKLGTIKNGSTPAGFSFSMGHSDPRASGFQKADVLPITCSLTSRGQPVNQAEYSMDVTGKEFTRYKEHPAEHAEIVASLVDDMSTTCFNLLSNLKVKKQQSKTPQTKTESSWMPSIIIENDSQVAKDNNMPDTEVEQHDQQDRKRIVIHNQGAPLTLELGHERK